MNENHARLFFALWPDQAVREQLTQACLNIPGLSGQARLVPSTNFHITIHFLGNIAVSDIDCFIHQAEKLRAESFDLELNRLGYFKKPKIIWIGCESVPPSLVKLHKSLGLLINRCGYTPESRPYHPHVTVARKINAPVEEITIPAIPWRIENFVLLRSTQVPGGVKYTVLRNFTLKPAR